ncbi:MAG: UbiH/UbiF/VisC/COQ6 family ubiquinone biosynthesis hydroxylase [Betaproteobacteria bacterium]
MPSNTSACEFDIAILGGGPVGCALALLLARLSPAPERIVLLQSDSASRYGHTPESDPRVLAVNHGSRVLLESLGAWPERCADIRTIHVSQRGRLGRTVIKHSDFAVPELGCVVRYGGLIQKLTDAVHASGVCVRHGATTDVVRQDANGVQLTQGQDTLHAAIVVQADGGTSSEIRRTYKQMALLTRARASLPRQGWAFERFTREGPLAILPHPEAPDQQSVVWCCTPERAEHLQGLEPKKFSQALTQAFGTRLGSLEIQERASMFPLALSVRSSPVNGRLIAIGNAAQTLHPVAGQGLNLGLRDAASLAIALRDWLPITSQPPSAALAQFMQMRQPDRQLTTHLTDLMSRVFTSGWPIVEHSAGLALLAMDLIPPLRAPLARHLLQGLRL